MFRERILEVKREVFLVSIGRKLSTEMTGILIVRLVRIVKVDEEETEEVGIGRGVRQRKNNTTEIQIVSRITDTGTTMIL